MNYRESIQNALKKGEVVKTDHLTIRAILKNIDNTLVELTHKKVRLNFFRESAYITDAYLQSTNGINIRIIRLKYEYPSMLNVMEFDYLENSQTPHKSTTINVTDFETYILKLFDSENIGILIQSGMDYLVVD